MTKKRTNTLSNLVAIIILITIATMFFWEVNGKKAYQEKQAHLETQRSQEIVLESNPTTGFTWQYEILKSEPTDILAFDQDYYSQCSDGMTGCGGYEVFTVHGLKEGSAIVRFVYTRAWEDMEPVKSFTYQIDVAKDKTLTVIKNDDLYYDYLSSDGASAQ